MITEIEQETSDIDWFFVDNENIAFVASGGGKLPQSVAKSFENTKLLASYFRALPLTSGIIINPDLSNTITTGPINEQYLADYIAMAKRGLLSFDKTVLNNFHEPNYHLVAKPVNPLKIDQLPAKIKKIILETKYKGSVGATLDIRVIE